MEERERSPCALASEAAARLGLRLAAAEVAALASDHDMGDAEPGAPAATLDCLAEKGGAGVDRDAAGAPRAAEEGAQGLRRVRLLEDAGP